MKTAASKIPHFPKRKRRLISEGLQKLTYWYNMIYPISGLKKFVFTPITIPPL